MSEILDSIIIGSGPAGLSAAVYGKRAALSLIVVEKEYEGTGQIAESARVDNYLGLPGIDGYELGEKFREHALKLGVDFVEQEVVKIEPAIERDGKHMLLPIEQNIIACYPSAFDIVDIIIHHIRINSCHQLPITDIRHKIWLHDA